MKKRLIIISCYVILLIVIIYVLGIKTKQYITPKAPKPPSQLAHSNMTSKAIIAWAKEAVVSTMSYDFENYHQQMQHASEYFTPQAWKIYMHELEASEFPEFIIKDKLVASAVVTGAPIILDQGIIADRYTWKVQIPLVQTYENAKESTKFPLMITLQIQRTNKKSLSKRGISISNFKSVARHLDF